MSLNSASLKTRTLSAILPIVIGYFGYSVADLCSKYLQQYYTIWQVLGISGVVGLTITGSWLLAKHGVAAFFPPNLKLHLFRAFLVLGTAYFAVTALRTLPLADFYGIVFMTPFLAMMLAVLILGEKVGWRRWLAAAVGLVGVFIIAGPQFSELGEGVIYATLGILCGAANVILLRKIGSDAPKPLYGFYPFLFISVFHLAGLWVTDSYTPIAPEHLPFYIVHGPVVTMGAICMSLGFAKAPETAVVAPFHYTQIIWGTAFGIIFFGAIPTQTTVIGLVIVIAAGLYSLWREYIRKHPELIH